MNVSKRQRRIEANKLFKQAESRFYPIDLDEANNVPDWMTAAWRSNRYTVMIDHNAKTTHGEAVRVMVQNHTDTPIINHWSEMQRIKNEIFGSQTIAIEYFPAEDDLIDRHNIYWMWIFPDGIIPKPLNL